VAKGLESDVTMISFVVIMQSVP